MNLFEGGRRIAITIAAFWVLLFTVLTVGNFFDEYKKYNKCKDKQATYEKVSDALQKAQEAGNYIDAGRLKSNLKFLTAIKHCKKIVAHNQNFVSFLFDRWQFGILIFFSGLIALYLFTFAVGYVVRGFKDTPNKKE